MAKPTNLDSHSINARLIAQIGRVLDDLEDRNLPIGPKERILALVAIGRLQVIFASLRKGAGNDSA